jgi:hypothetical protein
MRRKLGRGKVVYAYPKPKPNVQLTAEPIPRLFEGEKAFVMATGPSLDQDVIDRIYSESGWRYIGISDCYRSCPFLDFFYACDTRWWNIHYQKVIDWGGCDNGYWCTETATKKSHPDLHWIMGSGGQGWSNDPNKIHYGSNSGFQITNIAFLLGIKYMVLVGFNMMVVNDRKHFFGDHPKGLTQNGSYQSFASQFNHIKPPPDVKVINATSPTKLSCFTKMRLDDAISNAPK